MPKFMKARDASRTRFTSSLERASAKARRAVGYTARNASQIPEGAAGSRMGSLAAPMGSTTVVTPKETGADSKFKVGMAASDFPTLPARGSIYLQMTAPSTGLRPEDVDSGNERRHTADTFCQNVSRCFVTAW